MLKLKLQYFCHETRRTDSFEKTLMLGKVEEEKGMPEDEMVGWHHRLSGHRLGEPRELVMDRENGDRVGIQKEDERGLCHA